MNSIHSKSNYGFTLIELLVVIAIIGLLSSIVLASLNSARDKAKLAKALATMDALNKTAYMCMSDGTDLTIPVAGSTGGTVVCSTEPTKLPDISDTGFIYCGTGCGGWGTYPSGSGNYAISIYSDSYSGGRKIIVCGSNANASGWYYTGSLFDFTGSVYCKKDGF